MENLVKILAEAIRSSGLDKEISTASVRVTDFLQKNSEIINHIATEIREIPGLFAITESQKIYFVSYDRTFLTVFMLARLLLEYAFSINDAQVAVDEFLRIRKENKGHLKITIVLAGVQTERSIDLMTDVQLVPFKNLIFPKWIEDSINKMQWPTSRTLDSVAPSSALVGRVAVSPVFTKNMEISTKHPTEEIFKIEIMTYLIAIVMKKPVAIMKIIYEDDDPRLQFGNLDIASFNAIDWPGNAAESFEIDTVKAKAILMAYEKFKGDLGPIDTAIIRLTKAWSGWRSEDRFIDLGIALEVILMHTKDGKSDENSEISYKLGMRAGWLIGKDPNEKLKIFKRIRIIYALRSSAAHSGRIKTKSEAGRAAHQSIEESIALVGDIVIAVLNRGHWPDWDELVLGFTPS